MRKLYIAICIVYDDFYGEGSQCMSCESVSALSIFTLIVWN